MVIATLVLLFQAPAVPVRIDETPRNPVPADYYAVNLADERTSVTAFHPTVGTSDAPAPSRFDNDGTRLLDGNDDGSKVKPNTVEPVFPDMTSKVLSSVHIPPLFEKLPPLPERRSPVLRPGHLRFWLWCNQALRLSTRGRQTAQSGDDTQN